MLCYPYRLYEVCELSSKRPREAWEANFFWSGLKMAISGKNSWNWWQKTSIQASGRDPWVSSGLCHNDKRTLNPLSNCFYMKGNFFIAVFCCFTAYGFNKQWRLKELLTPIFPKTTYSPHQFLQYWCKICMRVSCVQTGNDIWQALRGYISENHPLWRGFQKEDGEHRKNCKIMKHQQKIDGETALKSQFLILFLVMAIVYNCQEDPRITLCPQMFKWN